jgi:hypothetical protein
MTLFRKLIAVPLLAAVTGLGAGVAANALTSPPSVQSQALRPNGITMVAGTGAFITGSSSAWVDLPGSQTSITVPTGSSAYVLARFTAESVCWGTAGWCPVRVVLFNGSSWEEIGTDISHYPNIGGAPTPAQSTFAFDSTNGGTHNGSEYASHAFEQHSRGIVNGTYSVKVQVGVTTPGEGLRIDDWHLTLESECYAGTC